MAEKHGVSEQTVRTVTLHEGIPVRETEAMASADSCGVPILDLKCQPATEEGETAEVRYGSGQALDTSVATSSSL